MVVLSRYALLSAVAVAILLPVTGRAQGILDQMQDEVASIVSRARPSIVSIEDERLFGGPRARQDGGERSKPDGATHERDHGGPVVPPGTGPRRPMGEPPKIGSGFSIGDGYIVTTADVLAGMKNPMVLTEDGRRIHAIISGIDSEMNIGLLKLMSKASIPELKLGQSSRVYPGHFAISIGNQYGHLNSVALTLVAGIRDDGFPAGEHFYPGLIQIAGTVGLGTSGAPILNARGEVIGMIAGIPFGDWTSASFVPGRPPGGAEGPRPGGFVNTAGPPSHPGPGPSSPGQGSPADAHVVFLRPPVTSAGFALPIDDMKPVLAGLRHGRLVHCWLGVDMKEESKREESDGIVMRKRSVLVSTVYPNSPAASAGLQPGDVLETVNGKPISRIWTVRAALLRAQPDDGLEFRVGRKGAEQTITAHMVPRPDQSAPPAPAKH